MSIGIIVANRNYGRWLPQLAESLENQRFEDWHLYLIDYGSTDASHDHYDTIRNRLGGRVTAVDFDGEADVMPLEAHNHGLDLAVQDGHEFVISFGADDIMLPEYLWVLHETLLGDMSKHAAWTAFQGCDKDGIALGKVPDLSDWWDQLPDLSLIPEPTLFRVSSLQAAGCLHFDWRAFDILSSIDRHLLLIHHFGGPDSCAFINEVHFLYRAHARQLSQTRHVKMFDRERALVSKRFWDRFEETGEA